MARVRGGRGRRGTRERRSWPLRASSPSRSGSCCSRSRRAPTRLPPGGRLVPVFVVSSAGASPGSALFAWWRRPDNAIGALMAAFGLAVLVSGLSIADAPVLYLLSAPADALALALFVHLLLAFPAGRLEDGVAPGDRASAATRRRSRPSSSRCSSAIRRATPAARDCPAQPDGRSRRTTALAEAALAVKSVAGVALALAAVVLVVRRARGRERVRAPRLRAARPRGRGPARARRRVGRRAGARPRRRCPAGGPARVHRRLHRAAARPSSPASCAAASSAPPRWAA